MRFSSSFGPLTPDPSPKGEGIARHGSSFLITIISLPRSSIALTAIVAFSPVAKGVPARGLLGVL
jgi:hypothetical protein